MSYKKILWGSLLLGLGFSAFRLINATAQDSSYPVQGHNVDVAIAGLKNAETQAAYMMQAESEVYSMNRDPVYGEDNNLNDATQIIKYLSTEKLQKRVSRWRQNGKEGNLDEIWYNLDKETGDAYTTFFSSGFDGDNTYSYLSPPHRHTGSGTITSGGRSYNGFLIGDPWAGNFSVSSDFSSELAAASPHFIEEVTINGLNTLKFAGSSDKGGATIEYKVWICPQRSFRCVRKDIQVIVNGPQYKRRHTVYETLSFKKYSQGTETTWLPQKGVSLDFLVDNSGKRYWRTLNWFNLLEAKPLPHLTQSIFTFQFPLGTTVSNSNEPLIPTNSNSQSFISQQLENMKVDKDIHDFVQQVVDKKEQ